MLCYQEQYRYVPIKVSPKFHQYSMNTVYENEQDRLFHHRYSQNQMRLKNLAYSEPSIPEDISYMPRPASAMPSFEVHHKYNNGYMNGGYGCTSPPSVYSDVNSRHEEQQSNYYPTIKRNGHSSIRSQSKVREKNRRNSLQHDASLSWDSNLHRADINGLPVNGHIMRNGNTMYSPEIYNGRCRTPLINTVPSREFIRCDSNQGPWQQWQWSRKEHHGNPTLLSPSSPLDSGLSSQSMTSSPSLEIEPSPARSSIECGSPLLYMKQEDVQCSCSTNSSNLLNPPIRNNSGRHSPWTQSAIARLNTLTHSARKNLEFRPNDPTYLDPTPVSPDSFDPRRFSMSGIYVDQSRRKHNKKTDLRRPPSQNGSCKSVKKQNKKNVSPFMDFKRVNNGAFRTSSPLPLLDTRSDQIPDHFQQLKIDTESVTSVVINGNIKSPNDDFLKSPEPESSASLSVSDSPTLLSSPVSVKSDRESQNKKIKSRKAFNQQDKAICELEEIYNKLNLDDYDLLDRAERRDLPTKYQTMRNGNQSQGLMRSKSDSFYEILGPAYCSPFKKSRAPPSRRSGVPDRIADDMAIRKLKKPSAKPDKSSESTMTYMLCNSHFTPTIAVGKDLLLMGQPDVEHDDLSYRRYPHANGINADQPQPPFGIPVKPAPPQSLFSDYLHVFPSNVPRNLCHPRGNPDLVRDDMAYRTLRKDHLERLMYDSVSLYTRKTMKG